MRIRSIVMTIGCLLAVLCLFPSGACAQSATTATQTLPSAPTEYPPIDGRETIAASEFQKSGDREWLSPVRTPKFAFDELIYSWKAQLPEGQGFRLYLQVGFGGAQTSPWLYAGYWGARAEMVAKRTNPVFDEGSVEMDQLLLKRKARTFQYKLVDEGDQPLTVIPLLHVIVTDNHPTKELSKEFSPVYAATAYPQKILDLPLRLQVDSKGKSMPDRCQSAALATAMQYFGKPVNLEDIVNLTNDPEYDYPGIWPRTVGTAVQFGFDAYIDRFRDWNSVRATLMQGKVILCSIKMPKDGDYIDPPYPSIGGHIVALNGLTNDGRVIVTDSYIKKDNGGYQCQWLQSDFEKIWMKTKGGVGMVICPPKDAPESLVMSVPAFPKGRIKKD